MMSDSRVSAANRIWQTIDRASLMPLQPELRDAAVGLFELVSELPIISPHGHVSPELLLENAPFESPADLFIYHNHYITRLLHADGVSLSEVRRPTNLSETKLREHGKNAWQQFAERWHQIAPTSSGYWFVRELGSVFGIEQELSANNAQLIYDQIQSALVMPEMRPRALFEQFKIEVLATTDSPADSLNAHADLAKLGLGGKVAPTLRPDTYIYPLASGWAERVAALCELTSNSLSQRGFVAALAQRRAHFRAHGAFSVDIGAETAFTTILDEAEAQLLFERAVAGKLNTAEAEVYRGHMIAEMIRMSCDDGLVVTLHVGVHRNHSTQTMREFGPDSGHDIPIRAEFTKSLHPVLERYGNHPNLHLILFSLDETTWSREVAPLAGFYSSVFIGAPWWFYDAPDAAVRFREAITDTAGFYRGSGFIDDTRAFLSIPTRHEMARRIDSAYLAKLVAQRRLSLATAERIAVDLVTTIPRRAFKLEG
jgi:glucuronate isomerase